MNDAKLAEFMSRPGLVAKADQFCELMQQIGPSPDQVDDTEFEVLHTAEVFLHHTLLRHGLVIDNLGLMNTVQMILATVYLTGRRHR